MIKLIRDTKTNKVTALNVNGKQFSVSRDLGFALSQEDEATILKSRELIEKAKFTQTELKSKSYIGDSKRLKLKVNFDDLNRINSKGTLIEFKQDIDSDLKQSFFELLEDFILSVNRAQYKRHLDYTSSIKNITAEKESA